MNCYLHPDATAVAFCRFCGRPVCTECQRPVAGTVYCPEHVPAAAYAEAPASPEPDPAAYASYSANPYVQPPPPIPPSAVHTSPGLAFWLGWIPGVGAIYNGQYLKGLIHALVYGLLMTIANQTEGSGGQPLFIMLIVAFSFYMPFEAYHTAKKRLAGVHVEEWSSLIDPGLPGRGPRYARRAPVGPIVLIFFGIVFLLDSLHIVEFRDVGRFWPVLLIVVGAYMLYSRLSAATRSQVAPPFSVPPSAGPAPSDLMGGNRE